MKAYLFTVATALGLLASSYVLASPDNGDSNGLEQGYGATESQDAQMDNNTNSLSAAGVSRDGETMGEED